MQLRGVAGELEDENWRLRSKTLDAEDLGSWKIRTGDVVVQLQQEGSWKRRTGDFVEQL